MSGRIIDLAFLSLWRAANVLLTLEMGVIRGLQRLWNVTEQEKLTSPLLLRKLTKSSVKPAKFWRVKKNVGIVAKFWRKREKTVKIVFDNMFVSYSRDTLLFLEHIDYWGLLWEKYGWFSGQCFPIDLIHSIPYRPVIQQHPAVDTHYISVYTVLSRHTGCRKPLHKPRNVSKSNHKRTVIRQVITGVINSLFLLAVLWYGRAASSALYGTQAAAADKVFIIITGNPSGNSLARDLLPPNQGFN